jgi:hypothetical protein
MSTEAANGKPAAALPRWKRRLFLAITLLLPVLLVAVVEIVLRLFGWGGYPPFITEIGEIAPGQKLCSVDADATRPYFFANPDRPGFAEETAFVMPKPADTVRIFLVGESAAKGYPQPRNLAMSAFLEEMLADLSKESGKKIEVINLGTTAVASYPLVAMTAEAARYQPDYRLLCRKQRVLRRLRHGVDQLGRHAAHMGAAADGVGTRPCGRAGDGGLVPRRRGRGPHADGADDRTDIDRARLAASRGCGAQPRGASCRDGRGDEGGWRRSDRLHDGDQRERPCASRRERRGGRAVRRRAGARRRGRRAWRARGVSRCARPRPDAVATDAWNRGGDPRGGAQ